MGRDWRFQSKSYAKAAQSSQGLLLSPPSPASLLVRATQHTDTVTTILDLPGLCNIPPLKFPQDSISNDIFCESFSVLADHIIQLVNSIFFPFYSANTYFPESSGPVEKQCWQAPRLSNLNMLSLLNKWINNHHCGISRFEPFRRRQHRKGNLSWVNTD